MAAIKHDMDHLLNQARNRLPGSSDAGIKLELYDVFREFFIDSNAWIEGIPVTILPDGVTVDYSIVPNGGQIIRLAGVLDSNGWPQAAIMPEIGTIHYANAFTKAQTHTASVVKSVLLPTSRDMIPNVPDWLLPLWNNVILDGIVGTMMGQHGKGYTDPKKSIYHLARFRDGIAQARVAALHRNTIGVQAWRFPQQFKTTGQRGGVSIGSDNRFS